MNMFQLRKITSGVKTLQKDKTVQKDNAVTSHP